MSILDTDRHDRLLLLSLGRQAVDDILQAHGIVLEKAIDPLTTRGYTTIVGQLQASLVKATRGAEDRAIRAAINKLDVDWVNMSAAGRDRVVAASKVALDKMIPVNVPKIEKTLAISAKRLLPDVRKRTIDRFGLKGIAPSLTARDKHTEKVIAESGSFFVRDRYGKINDRMGKRARGVVAAGIARGLGSDEITDDLIDAFGKVGQPESYWGVVSNAFVQRGRTATQMRALDDAGIERYIWESVLDEATSDICRFLHGKSFSVKKANARIDKALSAKPGSIKDIQPWISMGRKRDGGMAMFAKVGGRRRRVADVRVSAVGRADAIGEYPAAVSDAALEQLGVSAPPAHGNCRSTVVPA